MCGAFAISWAIRLAASHRLTTPGGGTIMSEHDAADIGRTFNCKFDDCTQPARTNRGPTAYLCDEHKQRRAAQAATKPKTGGLATAVSQLAAAAKNADKLAAHAKKLTERALAAKANADKAADDVRRAARELIDA